MRFDKKKTINLLEFIAIFTFFVLPPMLNTQKFEDIIIPKAFFKLILFIFEVFALATYEELLYRVYLPYRIKSFKNNKFFFMCSEFFPIFVFALAHRYLGLANILYAFVMGALFRVIYLFFKKLFAKRYAKKYSIAFSFLLLSFIHGLHNIIVIMIYYS